MDVTLITGFLGAGKTTLVKRLLREYGATMKIGVIVNDLSELEVDGELIRMGHAVSEKEGNLVSITEGSISDTRRPEFANALAQMIDAGMEHIFVETSGASHPSSIIEELTGCPYAMLRSVVCLVDGRALWHDYEGGRGLVAIMKDEPNPGDENADHLLMIQLRSASVIAMTKTDLLGSVELEELLHALQKINPSAKLTTCTFGKIDPRVLFQNSPFDLTANLPAPVLGADFGIGSTVVRDLRPLHPFAPRGSSGWQAVPIRFFFGTRLAAPWDWSCWAPGGSWWPRIRSCSRRNGRASGNFCNQPILPLAIAATN
jgi:G3E family GTPase